MSEDFEGGFYLVKIRRDIGEVKANAEQIDGKVYYFSHGWVIEEPDSKKFAGEFAMIPNDENYLRSAPIWISSGDLEFIGLCNVNGKPLSGGVKTTVGDWEIWSDFSNLKATIIFPPDDVSIEEVESFVLEQCGVKI